MAIISRKASESNSLICAVRPIQLSTFLHTNESVFHGEIKRCVCVYLLSLNLKIDVDSIQQFGFQIIEQVPGHLYVVGAARILALVVLESLLAELDPG